MKKIKQSPREQVQSILKDLSCVLVSRSASGESYQDDYVPADIMNATEIFYFIVSNFSIKNGFIGSAHESGKRGAEIRALVKKMTGVDTRKYYDSVRK